MDMTRHPFSKGLGRAIAGVATLLLTGCVSFYDTLPIDQLPFDFPKSERKKVEFDTVEVLQQFEADAETSKDYQIGAGDHVLVEVWDHPELSAKHIVGPDGQITLTLAGPLRLEGLTRSGAAQAINRSYGQYYENLAITVRVEDYVSNQVLVLGRVTKPGMIPFQAGPPTLLEAIAHAGGLPVGGTGAEKAALGQAAVFRGREKIAWIELKELLAGRNLALNIRLKRNDVIYIPDSDDQLVYVLGQVRTPGALGLSPGMTFLDALARAGGPTNDADPERIHVIRPSSGLNREVPMSELLKPNPQLNVALQVGDVIYVPANTVFKVGYTFEKLSPLNGFFFIENFFKSTGSGS